MGERWPPVYDAEELKTVISAIGSRQDWAKRIYINAPPTPFESFFQGDIVEFEADFPLLDSTAQPATEEQNILNWMVLGNSCDLSRSLVEVPVTQLLPIRLLTVGVTDERVRVLTNYSVVRQFYVPDWSEEDRCMYADYLYPVTIDRRGLLARARVVARMSHIGWMLLHACTVRFLCRDDGRLD